MEKQCKCCGISYDAAGWLSLPRVGVQRGDVEQPSLELRNCSCGSTLAVALPPWRVRVAAEEVNCNTKTHAVDAFRRAIVAMPRGTVVSVISPLGRVFGSISKGMPMPMVEQ
jgi:hypothetical protein